MPKRAVRAGARTFQELCGHVARAAGRRPRHLRGRDPGDRRRQRRRQVDADQDPERRASARPGRDPGRRPRDPISDPHQARELGIATVFQNLALVDIRDVAANLFLGREPVRWRFFVDRKEMLEGARKVLARAAGQHAVAHGRGRPALGRPAPVDRHRPRHCAARPRHHHGRADRGARRRESRKVLDLIVRLKAPAPGVVVISHNMRHVFSVADRIAGAAPRPRASVCGREQHDARRDREDDRRRWDPVASAAATRDGAAVEPRRDRSRSSRSWHRRCVAAPAPASTAVAGVLTLGAQLDAPTIDRRWCWSSSPCSLSRRPRRRSSPNSTCSTRRAQRLADRHRRGRHDLRAGGGRDRPLGRLGVSASSTVIMGLLVVRGRASTRGWRLPCR